MEYVGLLAQWYAHRCLLLVDVAGSKTGESLACYYRKQVEEKLEGFPLCFFQVCRLLPGKVQGTFSAEFSRIARVTYGRIVDR